MSKLINGIFQKLKDKFTKKVYNPKLTNLKVIKLCDTIDIERSKLNPLIKGFLLDESKGEHEPIDLNLNSLYNKETNKMMNTIFNCRNYYNTWYDYLKNLIFGNSLKANSLNKNYNNNRVYKSDFIFNCKRQLIAFINNEGDLIISNIVNNDSFTIKSNTISNEGIYSFNWDSINPLKLFYSSKNVLYESILDLEEAKIYINKYYLLNSNNFINCFPSPRDDLLILLYKNRIEVYDRFHKILFSKNYITFNFESGLYDNKSTIFIAFTEDNIILFNLKNFEFLVFGDFPGKILKMLTTPESENIYIFIQTQDNRLLMYVLNDISISSDINLNFNSYQNYDIFYRHQHYVLRPEIFCFEYKLVKCNNKILDINFSPKEERLGILYEELFEQNMKQNSLYIYSINKDRRDNNIDKIIPLYNLGHDDNNQICSFGFNKMIDKGNSFIIIRFDNDKFIKTINSIGFN